MNSAVAVLAFLSAALLAQAEKPSLTVYNQNFAVVREVIPLDLKNGTNTVNFSDVTAHVEPQSVMLRALDGDGLRVLEQNYRADPLSQGLLLNLFEGKTIPFLVKDQTTSRTVQGKIIRSGYVPHTQAFDRYGQQYQYAQRATAEAESPIIDVEGKIQFGLPGTPLFPGLGDDTILRPTLTWELESSGRGGTRQVELSYVSGGMSWNADYNLVLPPKGDLIELVGWVTIDNQSGKNFPEASIQLMAGDVARQAPQERFYAGYAMAAAAPARTQVEEKAFDEYHLYTLPRATLLRDRQTKQIEFVRAEDVVSSNSYQYDGAKVDLSRMYRNDMEQDRNFGIEYNTKVQVARQFTNSEKNHLGIPLPKGKMRVYRRDEEGRLQFTGENEIDHTPRDEDVKLITGNAFDITGKRIQTNFVLNGNQRWADESFEITLKNHKDQPVAVQVVEHLYRYANWQITQSTIEHEKKDSRTILFNADVPARGEKKLTYTVHYSWK